MSFRNYPIDRIVEIVKDSKIVTLKFLPFNEAIFDEHFPDMNIYPGSMVLNTIISSLEALIQKSRYNQLDIGKIILKVAKFRKTCTPGDLLEVEVCLKNREDNNFNFSFRVDEFFSGNLICNGKMIIKAE